MTKLNEFGNKGKALTYYLRSWYLIFEVYNVDCNKKKPEQMSVIYFYSYVTIC